QRHLHVFDDRHRSERGGDLERASDAEAPDLARPEAGEILLLEPDLAGVRRELAVDHVEAGRFAGAVRADHGQELAAPDREAHVVDGAHAAEGFGQRADRQLAHVGVFRRGTSRAKPPTMPPGKARTSSRMMTPRSARQYSVCRMIVSCSSANTEAPTIGPVRFWMPPSSTMTRPSIERPTWMVSGEIEPLAK